MWQCGSVDGVDPDWLLLTFAFVSFTDAWTRWKSVAVIELSLQSRAIVGPPFLKFEVPTRAFRGRNSSKR